MKKKSYYIVGNLPIYGKSDTIKGSNFIINLRIKYEKGLVSFQFNNQNDPFIFSQNSSDEFELDLASLVRLRVFITKALSSDNFKKSQFFSNTTLIQYKKFQKSIYITPNIGSILCFTFKNSSYEIGECYEAECLLELVKVCIVNLGAMQGTYDFNRFKKEVGVTGSAITTSKVVSDAPPPIVGGYIQSSNVPGVPPMSQTKEVIPQAPIAPQYVPAPPIIK